MEGRSGLVRYNESFTKKAQKSLLIAASGAQCCTRICSLQRQDMWVSGQLWNGENTDSSSQELPQDPGSASRALVLQENWAEFGVPMWEMAQGGRLATCRGQCRSPGSDLSAACSDTPGNKSKELLRGAEERI